MNKEQRAAALRLADDMDTPISVWADHVAHLLRDLAAEPVQEPVREPKEWPYNDDPAYKPVPPKHVATYYAAPQQRRPLTDEEALALLHNCPREDVHFEGWIRRQRLSWVRAIERHYGIGEAP